MKVCACRAAVGVLPRLIDAERRFAHRVESRLGGLEGSLGVGERTIACLSGAALQRHVVTDGVQVLIGLSRFCETDKGS